MKNAMRLILIIVYIAAMITANLLVWAFGPWLSPINSFILIGLDLTLRDIMHERLARWQLAGVILIGGVLTWIANPAAKWIAIASATAFVAAALADWITYAALHKHPWLIRSNGSNLIGAAVDSILFPTIAFGAFLPLIIALQFAAKVGGGFVWSFILYPILTPRPAISPSGFSMKGQDHDDTETDAADEIRHDLPRGRR